MFYYNLTSSNNGSSGSSSAEFLSSAESHKTGMAIRSTLELSECAAQQRLSTERADKVLDMVAARHCRHTPAKDWTTTPGTLRRPTLTHDVTLTVWETIVALVATTRLEALTTVLHSHHHHHLQISTVSITI